MGAGISVAIHRKLKGFDQAAVWNQFVKHRKIHLDHAQFPFPHLHVSDDNEFEHSKLC
jgi:hypothetical protein